MATTDKNPVIEKAATHIRTQCERLKKDIANARLMFDLDDTADTPRQARAFLLLDCWVKYTLKRVSKLEKSSDTEEVAEPFAKISDDIKTISKALQGYS